VENNLQKEKTNKELLNKIIKFILVLGMLYGMYYQINNKENLGEIYQQFESKWSGGAYYLLLATIFLAPVSRLFQALNWQSFLKLSYITRLKAIRSVLVGVAIGMFTPNAIGAYAGRLFFVEKKDHWRAIEATFLESISFMAVVLVLGAFSIAAYCPNVIQGMESFQAYMWFWAVLASVLTLGVYFNIRLTLIWSKRIPFLYRFTKKLVLIEQVEQKRLWLGLAYSFLRLSIQLLEYACLFYFFGINLALSTIIMGMSALYFLRLGIPLPNALNSLISGELMLLLFDNQGANDLSLLAVAFGVWIINIVFPALIGLVLIKDANLTRV